MRHVWSLLATATMLSAAGAAAQDSQARIDAPIRAAAPRVTEAQLGRAYDSSFAALRGSSVVPDAAALRQSTAVAEFDHDYHMIREDDELRANARVWGLVGAELRSTSGRSYAYLRAWQVRRIVSLPDDVVVSDRRPAEARYYLAAIYYGYLYEMRFSGSTETLRGGLGAIFPGGAADVSAGRARQGVEFHARGVGFEPASDQAIFASTGTEVRDGYRTSGEPQPILVEYRRIPGSGPVGPERLTVSLRRVTFSRLRSWGSGDGPPEIRVVVLRGGRAIYSRRGFDDTYELSLAGPESVVASGIRISEQEPLEFRFLDADLVSDDFAGGAFVTSLESGGSREFEAGEHVRFVLEATASDGSPPAASRAPAAVASAPAGPAATPSPPPRVPVPPPPAPQPRCSPPSQAPATLWVQNQCSVPVAVEWIGFDCQPRQYRVLPPGGRYAQQTFEGHVWRAVANGRVWQTGVAGSGTTMVVQCGP